MKWITHEIAAVGAACLLGMPPAGLGGVVLGSVLPDMLDQGLARLLIFRQLAFKRIHRGPTHWFGWWLALLLAGSLQAIRFGPVPEATQFATGIGFGALAHVVLDMCTITGVPVAPWSRKHMLSLNLCKTGSLREYAFLVLLAAVFGLLLHQDFPELVKTMKRFLA